MSENPRYTTPDPQTQPQRPVHEPDPKQPKPDEERPQPGRPQSGQPDTSTWTPPEK